MKQEFYDKSYFEGRNSNYSPEYTKGPYLPYWKELLDVLLEFKKSGKLLEVGCAFGYFCHVASKHFDCTGMDVSEYAINQAKKRYPNLKFFIGDISKLSLKQKFDIITSFDSSEHVQKFDESLVNIKNLLKDDGIFIMQVPFRTPIYKIFGFLDKDPTHISIFTEEELLKKLKRHFKIIKTMYSSIYLYAINKRLYNLKFPNRLKPLSTNILIVAKKK